MASPSEVAAMRRALELAQTPGVPVGPNPRVGCVLLDVNGEVIAEGYHRGAGEPHAEVDALARAGERTDGGTAIVTLEPCNHTGRTGPCAEALVAAGVSRVVFGQSDVNPVARGGAETLRAAGIEVAGGVLADEARAVNPYWTFAVENGRPHVTWKFAATLDGRSAASDGTSQWITSEAARADVHRLRAGSDTILVGTGTVIADDPRLTVRDARDRPIERAAAPLRAVMGLRDIPTGAAVTDDAADMVHLVTRDPAEALEQLRVLGRTHVWLEGGPTLAGAFVAAGLVDYVIAYIAPALLGSGAAAMGNAGIGTIADAIRLDLADVVRVGDDIRLHLAARKG